MLTAGRYDVCSVVTGHIRLDGGAMFGVVPRVLWSRQFVPDEQNRILLATRSLVAVDRDAKRVILVDSGTGTKWDADAAARYGVDPDPTAVERALTERGLTASDVTDVVVTHLHFDHNGGLMDWAAQAGGPTRLRYPNAVHWLHRRHWEHAHRPTLKDRASFISHDFSGLEASGQLRLIEGAPPAPSIPGVRWELSEGHTPAQLLPLFEDPERALLFVGDVFPTTGHLPPPWVMAYDNEPLRTIEEKCAVLDRCERSGLRLAFPHDPAVGVAEIDASDRRKPRVARAL
ncbi:MAG: MBL fold metallo-hydrolase [Phycisphaerales bacterium]|nr:MAG: MBL fold metallo-hydrolase [Phycisphaerales bacterium]